MINGGEFRNIKDEAAIHELAHFVSVEVFGFKAATSKFEAV